MHNLYEVKFFYEKIHLKILSDVFGIISYISICVVILHKFYFCGILLLLMKYNCKDIILFELTRELLCYHLLVIDLVTKRT